MTTGLYASLPDAGALNALAAKAGGDPALVQGPGGNVSLKHEGVLWVKASGTWLAHAETRDIMVPVALAPLLAALERDDPACETSVDFVRQDLNDTGLRPSIETTLHAVLPQAVVVHVHCVETLAWAVRADAETALAVPLAGMPWAFVPYARPGLPLTRAIEAALRPDTAVLVLGNHGLVVAAETVEAAEHLLDEVVRRLRLPPRLAAPADLPRLIALARDGYRIPAWDHLHGIATNPAQCRLARSGSLYPDHVIFLGPGVISLGEGETAADALARAGRPGAPLLVVPGAGVLVHDEATPSMLALAGCLADVTARIVDGAAVATLGPDDEAALLGWDAEKYRQALDRQELARQADAATAAATP